MISEYLVPADLQVGDRFCEDTYPEVWEVSKRYFASGHRGVLATCIGYIDPRWSTGRIGEQADWFGEVCLYLTDQVYGDLNNPRGFSTDELDEYYKDLDYARDRDALQFKEEADEPFNVCVEPDEEMPSQIDFSGGIRGRFCDIKEKLREKQSIYSKAMSIIDSKDESSHTCCILNGCKNLNYAQLLWDLYQQSVSSGKTNWDLLRAYWSLTNG